MLDLIVTADAGWTGGTSLTGPLAVGNLRRFHAAGGKVRYGTDLGNGPLPLAVNAREIAALGEAGLGGLAILRAVTAAPLAPGHRADLAAVPADPLSDPGCLTAAVPVLRAGRTARPSQIPRASR